jgi:secreted PhoX family phosphatase
MLGATAEFNKFEGVTVNAKDKKVYFAMSYIEKSMLTNAADPVDDIHISQVSAGAVYEMSLSEKISDTQGNLINSSYVGATLSVPSELLGVDLASPDAIGNTADANRIANPDNLKFSEKMRTLFIGEDSGMHVNNFLWAFNVDTRKLSRILSLPAGAESTGLQAVDNLNGFSYVLSSYQHAGDYTGKLSAETKAKLDTLINKRQAAIGYLSIPHLP